MKFDDITNRLSEKQKQRLREAKTNEDLNSLFTSDKLLLTEDQLGGVAGGGGCFGPETVCEICGATKQYAKCTNCYGVEMECPDCGEIYYSLEGHVCLCPQEYRVI